MPNSPSRESERTPANPLHPIGRVRRRWPAAEEGIGSPDDVVHPRYRRAFEADQLPGERQLTRKRSSLETLRASPLRNGLIGLAVAGTGIPIAVNRYQQAMRTDPTHETALADGPRAGDIDEDSTTTQVWRTLEDQAAEAAAAREKAVVASLEQYADYGLGRALAEQIYDLAIENGIEPQVAFGLVRAESSFRNTSTSPVGAVGLTQLMPKTARWLQPGVTQKQLREPGTNLRIGFKYLRRLIDKYEGDEKLALLAYNRGPGTVDKAIRTGRNPDNGYADFVHGRADHGHTLYSNR